MIAIDLSLTQLKTGPELIYDVLRTTARWELAPWDLRFDVTEATLAQTKWTHNDVLPRLCELGVQIAIDDFGTEYSSFDYLKTYRVNHLKLAQRFLDSANADPEKRHDVAGDHQLRPGRGHRDHCRGRRDPGATHHADVQRRGDAGPRALLQHRGRQRPGRRTAQGRHHHSGDRPLDPTGEPAIGEQSMNPMSVPANRRILVVDDTPAIHQDFRKILSPSAGSDDSLDDTESLLFGTPQVSRLQFQIDSAYQGEEALELVKRAQAEGQPYALVFADMRMPPGWDGLQTIEALWEADPRLQIALCTAFSDYSWETMSERIEFDDQLLILKKPFDTLEIRQMASAMTWKWQLAQDAARKKCAAWNARSKSASRNCSRCPTCCNTTCSPSCPTACCSATA
nr:hypothetical protein GCM10020185_51230 [Pseudomonas brassicacearum subsp. brassicacearum]